MVLKSCSSVKFVNRVIDMQICFNKRVVKGGKLDKPHVSFKQYLNSWQVRINSSIWILKHILSIFETMHHIVQMGIFWKSTGIENQKSHRLGFSHFSQRSENEKSHLSQSFSQSVRQSVSLSFSQSVDHSVCL